MKKLQEQAGVQNSDCSQLPIFSIMIGTDSNMDMTQPISTSVQVKTLKETRVIETQTDPELLERPPTLVVIQMDKDSVP